MRKNVLDMIERGKYNIAAEVINKLIGELDVETVTRIAQIAHIDFRSYKAEVDYQWVDNTDTHPAKVIMMFEFLDKPFYLTRGGFFMIGAMRLKNLFEYLLINRLDELKQIKWYLIAEVFSWGDSPKSIEVLKSIFDNLGPFDATEARGYLPHLERNNTTKLMKLLGDYLH
jgi:hypothetical protein